MSRFADNTSSERVVAPHKARILVIAGAAILVHAALLFFFWPHRWPASYKWLLLPDSVGAYFLFALGLQNLKDKTTSEHEGHEGTDKVTKKLTGFGPP